MSFKKVDNIIIENEGYELQYHFEPVEPEGRDSREFALDDLSEEIKLFNPNIKEFLVIDSFIVHPAFRGKGMGSKVLKDFCESYDDKIIFLLAGANTKEYPEEPPEQELLSILRRLENFYVNIGFINVNEHIGDYQFKTSFIYENETSKPLLERLFLK